MTDPQALIQLQALEDALLRFEDGAIQASALNDQARAAKALLGALPQRYSEVLFQLLDRVEASALFDEESCSFSQDDLRTHLHGWVDKARQQLQATA